MVAAWTPLHDPGTRMSSTTKMKSQNPGCAGKIGDITVESGSQPSIGGRKFALRLPEDQDLSTCVATWNHMDCFSG